MSSELTPTLQVQPAAAPKVGGAWAKPGELVQRLGSREQSESRSTSANTSEGSTPTSQVYTYLKAAAPAVLEYISQWQSQDNRLIVNSTT